MQHNNLLLTEKERLTAELLTQTSENSRKSTKEDVIQMENNIGKKKYPQNQQSLKPINFLRKKIRQE